MLVYHLSKSESEHSDMHKLHSRGMAYENDDFFVHYYCANSKDWAVSTVSRVVRRKAGTLREWVETTFGATEIQNSALGAGETIAGVWRPGIEDQNMILRGLNQNRANLSDAAKAQTLLLKNLSEIFNFIEPRGDGLRAYGHKSRELLILACTEVENSWASYLKEAGLSGSRFSTNDYVKLKDSLHLHEFAVELDHIDLPELVPFRNWDVNSPTQTLEWYDAYNRVKHNRIEEFQLATVENCILAVSASLILFAVRFGPYYLSSSGSVLSGLFNEMFSISLKDPDPSTFYVPDFEMSEEDAGVGFIPFSLNPELNFTTLPFTL